MTEEQREWLTDILELLHEGNALEGAEELESFLEETN